MHRTCFALWLATSCTVAGCVNAPEAPFAQMSAANVHAPGETADRPQQALVVPIVMHVAPASVVTAPLALAPQPVSAPAARSPAFPPLTGGPHALNGIASYYWQDQMTSSGERFDKRALTAAHKTLPLGSKVRVTSAATGRSVVVRINDRGPFKGGRVIDLSEAAAEQLQMTGAGLAPVKIEVLR